MEWSELMGFRKFGDAQPITRVEDEGQAEADPQGINVTAAREERVIEVPADTYIETDEEPPY
jgi:hypothetical protein